MNNDSSQFKKILINSIKLVLHTLVSILTSVLLPVIIIIILLASSVYFITIDDGTYKEDDWSSVPFGAGQYTQNANVDSDGKITTTNSAEEIWDKMHEEGARASLYLDNAEELTKLMNAEVVTQYLDTRPNPDEEIDWDSINKKDSKELQGIIKLKRADDSGNKSTMTYVDPETFQKYIDDYNNSGSESDRKKALSHFTIEKTSLSSDSGQTPSKINAGTAIKIPSGLGSIHTYMGWQKITSTTSTQYKLREKAGMNFDDEGFGKINGRYVIACTTTFGDVGDYIDFYQEDGTVIPCIIGDIKSRGDAGCTKWGHNNGHCIIEFVVDKDTWYNSNHPNPGTTGCHPEWNKNLIKAVNGGNYFDNPNFGTDTVTENNTVEENEDSIDEMNWPTDGTNVTSQYGNRNSPTAGASSNHKGIDIGIPEGTNIYACESGKVTTAGSSSSAGNWIVIDHGNGYVSKYMHNSELKVKVGDKVKKGDVIALSGNTGISTGPHLHFQIEYDGEPVDPMTFKYNNGMGNGDGGIGSNSSNIDSSTSKYYAKVATWSEETNTVTTNDPDVEETSETTYNMTTTNVNYQDFVSGYKMPFDYLWALLVVGEDKDFVLSLADLVYNSEIEITVHDNLTVNTDTTVDTYTKKTRTDTEGKITMSYGLESSVQNITETGNWSDEESNDYKTTHTTITKTNTLNIALTKANVWIVDYTQEYTYQEPKETTDTNTKKLKDKDYGNTPDTTSQDDTYGHVNSLIESKKSETTEVQYDFVEGKADSINTKVYHATVNRNREITNKVETTEYTSAPANTREKTDKKAQEDNFVTLLLKDECKKAKTNILEVPSWLYEILENNQSTADMVDLTKYLLYKVTGREHGVKEYDFSAYDPSNFVTTSDKIAGATIEEKVWFAILDKGFNEYAIAGVMGNIYAESGFNPKSIEGGHNENDGGIGLCQWTNSNRGTQGRNTNLKRYAQSKGTTWKDEDIQVQFLLTELTGSGDAHGYANKAFMTTTMYGKKYTESDWKNASSIEDATKAFCATFERPGKVYFDSSMPKRTDAAKKYYNQFHGKERSANVSESGGNQKIVGTAKSKIGCPYVWGAKGPNSFDCSGLVYWCYKQEGKTVPSSTDGYKPYKGSNKEISWNEAQPGDILIIFKEERTGYSCGHAAIYLGGDKYIHAPGTGKTVTIVDSGAKTKFKHVFRF